MTKVVRIVLMCFFFIGDVHLYAQKNIIKSEGLSYSIQEEYATLIRSADGDAYQGDVIIPEYVEFQGKHYSVTQIGAEAFCDCTFLISARIPPTVKYIKAWAFKGCQHLASVEIPEDIALIDATAFYGCTALPQTDGLRYAGKFLVSVADSTREEYEVLPGTRWIGANALAYLGSVKSVTLPPSVEVIGCFAFSCCPRLEKIQFPKHLVRIEHFAFSSCTRLSELKQLSSVEESGQFLFQGCKKERTLENIIDHLSEKKLPYY